MNTDRESDQSAGPPESEQELLLQAQVDIQMLKHDITALRHVVSALAVRLVELDAETPERTKMLLAMTGLYATHVEAPVIGKEVTRFLEEIIAATPSGIDPMRLMLFQALLAKGVGVHRLDALATWFGQGSDDEIVQDVRQLLEQWPLSRAVFFGEPRKDGV